MSELRTLILAMLIVFGWANTPRTAYAGSAEDPLYRFATCAGRLSALVEFQWLTDGPASEETQRLRDAMIELIDATMPSGEGHKVLAWRIDAKAAQSKLLTAAHFGPNKDQAAWSMERAMQQIGECRALLLS